MRKLHLTQRQQSSPIAIARLTGQGSGKEENAFGEATAKAKYSEG